ncbi:hypothetical protein EDC96DRAFT_576871 [Choanephora cucurbitarum]|nr:hypothetical protein EDC96DRAFT_576871 [Choanephora cucurbitarum]
MSYDDQEQFVQETPANAPRLLRHNPFTNRPIPRSSRLRPPQAIVYRDPEGNIMSERPSNISSAISITRANYLDPLSESALDPGVFQTTDISCTQDERAVNLSLLCHQQLERIPTSHNYVPLGFDIIFQDGGQYSYNYAIQNILRNDQSIYCASRCGTVNILLKFTGSKSNEFRRSQSCYLSHVIIKAPLYGTSFKYGMIFTSNQPIDIEVTRPYDLYHEQPVEDNGLSVTWFNPPSLPSQQVSLIHLNDKSAKYVLIKLIGTETECVNLEYVGFVGYVGSRCFASAKLC